MLKLESEDLNLFLQLLNLKVLRGYHCLLSSNFPQIRSFASSKRTVLGDFGTVVYRVIGNVPQTVTGIESDQFRL